MFPQLIVLLCVIAVVVSADNLYSRDHYEGQFFEHMQKYSLKFTSGKEFIARLQIFADNYDYIETSNKQNLTYTLGLNQFSHMTHDEWKDYLHLGGVRPPNLRRNPANLHEAPKDLSSIPTSVDWVASGAVTGVKNQGNW